MMHGGTKMCLPSKRTLLLSVTTGCLFILIVFAMLVRNGPPIGYVNTSTMSRLSGAESLDSSMEASLLLDEFSHSSVDKDEVIFI